MVYLDLLVFLVRVRIDIAFFELEEIIAQRSMEIAFEVMPLQAIVSVIELLQIELKIIFEKILFTDSFHIAKYK